MSKANFVNDHKDWEDFLGFIQTEYIDKATKQLVVETDMLMIGRKQGELIAYAKLENVRDHINAKFPKEKPVAKK